MKNNGIELYREELELLERSKENIRKSKLSAGFLFIPETLSDEFKKNSDEEPDFVKELTDYLTKPVEQNPSSDPRLMGFILKAPVDEQVKHINLDADPTGEREKLIDSRIEYIKSVLDRFDTENQ